MTESKFEILITEKLDSDAVLRLREIGKVTELASPDEEHILQAVPSAHAMIVRTYSTVTRKILAAASKLKVIGRAGVGIENIDIEAARERNIQVVYTPEASTDAVAELTIGMMISLVRGIHRGDQFVRDSKFAEGRRTLLGRELHELTLGILGLGRIGKAVGRRANRGLGMPVLYTDIVQPGYLDFVATSVTRSNLFAESDIISIHLPLTFETTNLFNADSFAACKPGAIFINTARGGVVDAEALAAALISGQIGGAALDVFDPEPLPPSHPLLTCPNTLFTPHIGARTNRAQARMNSVVDDVIRVLQGQKPRFPAWE